MNYLNDLMELSVMRKLITLNSKKIKRIKQRFKQEYNKYKLMLRWKFSNNRLRFNKLCSNNKLRCNENDNLCQSDKRQNKCSNEVVKNRMFRLCYDKCFDKVFNS
jgi:hypothetical protein